MTLYLLDGKQSTQIYLTFDFIASTLILAVGIVMVLQTLSLKQGIQHNAGHRTRVTSIPLMLCLSVPTVLITVLVLAILIPKYTYFAVAGFDIAIALALFITLKKMQEVIATVPMLLNFEGEVYARKFVMTFGFSFIVAMVLNFCKSLFWGYFIELITHAPVKFVSVCFITNLVAEIFPILLLIVMHRRNFDPDES